MTSLAGKRVLITGGAGGVGRATTAQLLAAGARVLVADREGADFEAVRAGGTEEIETVAADLSTSAGIAQMFARVDQWLGGLDILVACAGVGSGPLMEMAEPDWRYVIESNLLSYVACTQGAIERIRGAAAEGGMVILVGSISVHIKAVGESVYNAAKGGVASFAETLRKELMSEGIRLTLIEPGAIGSAMQPFPAEERARQVAEHRMLPPDAVADAILFAATRPAGVDVVTLRIEPLVQKIY
ncbi:SDR family oxidoreductase [Sphingomonas psychrotolerans]|uniref:SDR family oxidoreductase n=1 Tax=Sphingomonas psychrotolerans TaxID=1327635 RepID=A0ABU3N6L1_9SPHN|nr:SDR family oxidoreductase [Sphingomonas psychrotolerans]MDT8760165.1 SDR family oxidoreductase [Sphingomonas psychrotolerans]